MIGGVVIEVACVPGRDDVLFVDCAERQNRKAKVQTCAILVERNVSSEKIQVGDSLWWQGQWAMWTPQENRGKPDGDVKCGVDFDVRIPRVGYSGVKHPMRSGQ